MTERADSSGRPVEVAAIVRPWGRHGAVLVDLSTEDPSSLVGARDLVVGHVGGRMAPAVVLAVQERGKGRAAVEIEGVGTIEQAEALRGQRLFRPAGAAPRLPEGRFYAFELIGMRVVTAKGEEIGLVEEIRQTGGADLLVVRGGGRERLIPFARSICPRVAPAEGVIEIDPPEGLLELDEV